MKTNDVVQYFKTKSAIAKACTDDGWKLTSAAVSQWGDEPPLGRQKQIEALTNGTLRANADQATAAKQNTDLTSPKAPGTDMTDNRVEDLNIESIVPLITPNQLKKEMPITDAAIASVCKGRQVVRDILDRKDHRIFVVIGPCSIHDVEAAKDYAMRLRELAEEVSDTLYLIMRVYFEKPRTTVGWKGLINDPYMNDTFKIHDGLHISRKLLIDLAELGLPLSTEALDPISPQYLQDLITWSAIGARTTESQTHREMASGLSSAVGFKNGTDGSLTVATNALMSVANPHRFLGIDQAGSVSIVSTKGNPYGHVVLRGGGGKPNYDSVNVAQAEQALDKSDLMKNIMVDCSHENSNKNPALQPLVMDNVSNQILDGNKSIIGLMVESNIKHGRQNIPANLCDLEYGLSVTDGCISWEETEEAIRTMRAKLKDVLPTRGKP
ncbi:MAG: 3-deoxy-7-phosphoheptulonate synthase [Thalassolituus sp.]|jgi:3-deoxy-7-phosphoheptulonate synthase|uniref:3-deoxy-7-phosphoheptulonate synthase n=2 Tax=root TaxID=1 RepID=M5E3H3_9GAMM|nr:3-deoxy-7-phosphoheptulonate synthase [Thalassolituus oleivorans]PCI48575.1 MAG: 3-deoxy-7-phosphoheptulonate synthase [Oceanospirillales bacterium]PHQ84754.1 MAG: 3-deoxy-7-phosphoheptulonate synthase [Thalassobium sp.]AHK15962.1 phospho-2-dehydro-3-deoxyheptonate aldolase [Thalassolituus oleivorans R6-15]MBQ0726459.1 3-deoxy-7-phosphoheptulonate synthase [Thalassolituus oleivorans]MBQ0781180.1 3-deoxy-7-phosphoheptulonate synthase [Thalassolituus oleivorans]